jgi:hypothetical protein
MSRKRKRRAARQSSPTAQRRTRSVSILSRPADVSNAPRTALSQRSLRARDRSENALTAMRRDLRLRATQAAKLYRVKVATIQKYFPSELRKVNGRLQVRTTGRYSVTLYLPDEHGNAVPIHTRSYRERKQASDYLRDVGRYLGGDRNALSKWRGKKIAGVDLVTEGRTLVAIEPALSEFSLYRALNGGAA